MTIQNNPTRNQYTATSGQTVFNYNFEIIAAVDISVFKGDTRLAISTDYTLTGVGNESGGTVTLVVGATTGDIITIYRSTVPERLTDYQNSGDFLSDEVNSDFDRIWAVIQEIDGGKGRYLQLSDTTTSSLPVTLDEPIASQILRWKDDSSGVESVSLGAISPGSSVATDFCIYKTNYNAVRSIDVSEVVDGQTLTVTDESIGGQGVLRNVVGHGLTDNGGTIIVIDANWYWERIYSGAVNVKWFGAAGDGVTDNTAAIQNTLNAAKYITFGDSSDNFLVLGTLILSDNHCLHFNEATLTQGTDQTITINAGSTDGCTIFGGKFVGKSEASFTNTSSSLARCISGSGTTNLTVSANKFVNFYYSPIYISSGGDKITFSNNTVTGPGNSVLGVDINYRNCTGVTLIGKNLQVVNNDIADVAQGVIIGQGSSEVLVSENVIHDLINEHGIYADTGIKRIVIADNIIRNTGAVGTGLKVQCYDSFGIQPDTIAITGNTISNTGSDGILINNITAGTPTILSTGCVISGNTVIDTGAYGIDIRDTQDCNVTTNVVINSGAGGIFWKNCNNLNISENIVRGCVYSAISEAGPVSNYVTIKDNGIKDCATGNVVGDEYGIYVQSGGSEYVIAGNIVTDANANMERSIFIAANINSTCSIYGNICPDSTAPGFRLGNAGALRIFRDNLFNGAFNASAIPVVDSSTAVSGGVLTLPQGYDTYEISGTNNFFNITPSGHSGEVLTLIFQGIITVTDTSNLKLSGNFITSADSTLVLACNGTNWYEVSRSRN